MGNKLFSEVTQLTGLPEDLIQDELTKLLADKGVSPQQMTMESLRQAMAAYLEQIQKEMESSAEILDSLDCAKSPSQ